MKNEYLSFRETADILDIDPVRLIRLAHVFKLAPGEKVIPRAEIREAEALESSEGRYLAILHWLVHTRNSSARPPRPLAVAPGFLAPSFDLEV